MNEGAEGEIKDGKIIHCEVKETVAERN